MFQRQSSRIWLGLRCGEGVNDVLYSRPQLNLDPVASQPVLQEFSDGAHTCLFPQELWVGGFFTILSRRLHAETALFQWSPVALIRIMAHVARNVRIGLIGQGSIIACVMVGKSFVLYRVSVRGVIPGSEKRLSCGVEPRQMHANGLATLACR